MKQCWRQNSQTSTCSSTGRHGKRRKLRSGIDVAEEGADIVGREDSGFGGRLRRER